LLDRTRLVLLDMNNRMLGPYIELITQLFGEGCCLGRALHAGTIAEMNRIHLVLFDLQNMTLGPYLATTHMILISVMRTAHAAVGRGRHSEGRRASLDRQAGCWDLLAGLLASRRACVRNAGGTKIGDGKGSKSRIGTFLRKDFLAGLRPNVCRTLRPNVGRSSLSKGASGTLPRRSLMQAQPLTCQRMRAWGGHRRRTHDHCQCDRLLQHLGRQHSVQPVHRQR
jgi:hypothetical protein